MSIRISFEYLEFKSEKSNKFYQTLFFKNEETNETAGVNMWAAIGKIAQSKFIGTPTESSMQSTLNSKIKKGYKKADKTLTVRYGEGSFGRVASVSAGRDIHIEDSDLESFVVDVFGKGTTSESVVDAFRLQSTASGNGFTPPRPSKTNDEIDRERESVYGEEWGAW